MHVLAAADDRVDGTGLNAFGAADAIGLGDHGDQRGLLRSASAVVRQGRHAKQTRKRTRACVTAGWTAIDRRKTGRKRFRIRPASRKSALAALRLWQQAIDPLDHRVVLAHFTGIPGIAPASTSSRCKPAPSFPADRIIPSLMPKRILRGARLAMNTTLRPTRDSGVA